MPTLVIENVPAPLFERLQRLAEQQKRTPADAALEVLETALPLAQPAVSERLPRNEILLTPEVPAPFDIPRPEGELVDAGAILDVADYVPEAHDIDLPGAE